MEMVNKMSNPYFHDKIKPEHVFSYADKILTTYGDTSLLSDSEREVGYHVGGCSLCYSASKAYMAFARSIRVASQVPVERNLCA